MADVLPSQGHRFFFSPYGKQGDPDFKPLQVAFAAGKEQQALMWASKHSLQGANSYFATGGFMPPPINPKTGKPKGGRTADRVMYFRCLRLDIDCGEGKPYTTKKEAFHALTDFCGQYAIPLPYIVDSGYGLHLYWPFDRDVNLETWKAYAARLASACRAFGLDVDATTTEDAARVLRVPGTFNYKRGAAVEVRIVHQGTPTLPDTLVAHFPAETSDFGHSLGPVPAALLGEQSELQQNLLTPYKIRGVLSKCPGMGAMLNNGGAKAQEPLWHAALNLVWKSDEAPETKYKVAHALSVGHPDYTDHGFLAKWEQVQSQDYRPPRCETMASLGMAECAGCPFNGKIPSPLVLGYPELPLHEDSPPPMAPMPQQTLDPGDIDIGLFTVKADSTIVPKPGWYGKSGIHDGQPAIRVKDNDGYKTQVIVPYPIMAVERLLDADGQKSLMAITFNRGLDKPVRIEMDNRELTDGRTFHSALMGHGVYISRKHAADFMETFMPEFLSQLQRVRAANTIAPRCGWTEDGDGFVLGTTLKTLSGSESVRPGNIPDEMLAFHTYGDEAKWRRAFDIVLSGGPERQAVVALAMASPLMKFTGLDGVMLNAYSPESGIGKSTLGDAALSVWGSPDKLRKSARDTANATWRIAGVLGNMPMVIDEFTNVDGRALSDFVYTVTQGREKHRLTSDARLQSASALRWCLACITTANNSVHDKLQAYRGDAEAEAARVFDMRLYPLDLKPEELGKLKTELQALRGHYGFLGPQLVDLYLAKDADHWQETIMERISYWDRTVSQSASDRFRSACAALIEVGAAIGKAMGYNFDVEAIRNVLEASWRKQIKDFDRERKSPLDYVVNYISEHSGEFIQFGGQQGDAVLNNTPRKIHGELRGISVNGRFKPDTVMVPSTMLREYVRSQNGDYKMFMEWVRNQAYSGVVRRFGKLVFLQGLAQQHTVDAVEFNGSVLNNGIVESLVPVATGTSVPAAPAPVRRTS